MTRFKTRLDGLNQAKRYWVCRKCDTGYEHKIDHCRCGEPRSSFIYLQSKAEYIRYKDLRLMQHGGVIYELTVHPAWDITIDGVHICKAVMDFAYRDSQTHACVVEDVKGNQKRDELAKVKRRLVRAVHGHKVKVVRVRS